MKRTERVRVFFSKTGDLRHTSHLDLSRAWERALRRSALPLEFSRGFNPRLRLSFSSALPTGVESEAEFVEIVLEETVPSETLVARLDPVLPAGIRIVRIERDAGRRDRPRPRAVTFEAVRDEAWPPTPGDWARGVRAATAAWVGELLETTWLRREHTDRPSSVEPPGSAAPPQLEADEMAVLHLSLRVRDDGSTVRLADVLRVLVIPPPDVHPLRLRKLAPVEETAGSP